MPSLTIVLDYVACLRQIMTINGPDPVAAAIVAQLAGADGVAVHLREDRRYLQDQDVRLIRQMVDRRLILHMAATSEMVGFALDIKPERVVLVPRITDEGAGDKGLDLIIHSKNIYEIIDTLQSTGISAGVCISADPEQAKLAHQIRAEWVQIHAGHLQAATSRATRRQALDRIIDTVKMARKLRLNIAIGHGLDMRLIKLFKGLSEIDEFSIGQSLIAHALLKGMQGAIGDTIDVIRAL
jgi:pyridoxine 5-phosphate synthase